MKKSSRDARGILALALGLTLAISTAGTARAATAPSPPPSPSPTPVSGVDAVNQPCTHVITYPGTTFRYCGPDDLIPRSITANGSPAKAPAYGAWDETVNGATVHHGGMDPNMDWSDAIVKMCFPIRSKAYANSLVYRPGGDHYPSTLHPAGSQSNAENFGYPWRDNFCESRDASRKNPSCNVGHGHQGQDIRPEKPVKVTYVAIAPEDANVVSVPGADGKGFTVTLLGKSEPHRKYRYLHMEQVQVSPDHPFIHAGDEIGLVSDYFGWHMEPQFVKNGKAFALDGQGHKIPLYVKSADGAVQVDAKGKPIQVKTKVFDHTLIHLHFEIFLSQAETINGTLYKAGTYVSPYVALVNAYGRRQLLTPGETDVSCRTQ